MKKISTKAKNKSRNDAIPGEDHVHGSDEGKEGDENIESSPTVHLGNAGVKLEAEGHVGVSGGLLETVEEVVEAPWGEIPGPDVSQVYVVDLTQQFNRIFVQTTFNSFKEFEKLFNKFKAETGSVFRIKSSCSIAYENSRRKKHFIPSRFKFVTVRYCCVHYGQPKVAGQGIRTKQRYLPCGCESVLSVSYNRGALVISQANMRHNHEVSSEMAPFYAINRRISNAELRDVAGVVEMIPSSRALQHFLQIHFRRPTTLQDAKNVRARLKALKVPPPAITEPQGLEESQVSPHEEEEEEEAAMDSTEEGADDDSEEVMGESIEGSESDCWVDTTRVTPKTLKQQQQRQEEEEQELELIPSIKKGVLSEIKNRLFGVLDYCDARVFRERVSVLERLIEGWENGDTVHIHYTEVGDLKAKMCGPENIHSTNTHVIQERTCTQSSRNTNSRASVDSQNFALPVFESRGKPQFFPAQSNGILANSEHKSQSGITSVMEVTNGKSNITTTNSSHGNLNKHSKTVAQSSREMQKSETNERRPIILSIVKGFVGDVDQAVEVVIEVDGEVARVRAVKQEPLDYYEVNVGD